jgi:hypothetical protein
MSKFQSDQFALFFGLLGQQHNGIKSQQILQHSQSLRTKGKIIHLLTPSRRLLLRAAAE